MPTNTHALKHLRHGLQAIAEQRYQEVHAKAIDMIHADVNDAVPYCLLASVAAAHGNHQKALELYQRAVAIEPTSAYYQAYLGQCLTTIGEQQAAKSAADLAADLVVGQSVDDAYLADTIGVIYSRTGFHEKAVPFFQRAVSLDSEPANFHYNLAASQQFLGDFDVARQSYFATLERDPKAYRAWSSLVALGRQTDESNHLQALMPLFVALAKDEDACLHLGHAIAKTLEDLGRYEESLEWLHKAKRLKLANTAHNLLSYQPLFDAVKSASTKPIESVKEDDDSSPIFIIGLPRTGTTLVDRILSSHSDVVSAGELNIFPGLIKRATKTPSNMVMDAETFNKSGSVSFGQVGQEYLRAAKELSRGAPRFTDKMPLNFFYAGLIHKALPNARIIALRRGAMDSCLSNYRQLLTVQHSYYHYTYDLSETAAFYKQFDELMSHWRTQLPANRFMEIRYEDIVHDQEQQTRRLLEFCNLGWQDACLSFHENAAPVATASSVQVRQPLYSGSIGRWRRYENKLDDLKAKLEEAGIELD